MGKFLFCNICNRPVKSKDDDDNGGKDKLLLQWKMQRPDDSQSVGGQTNTGGVNSMWQHSTGPLAETQHSTSLILGTIEAPLAPLSAGPNLNTDLPHLRKMWLEIFHFRTLEVRSSGCVCSLNRFEILMAVKMSVLVFRIVHFITLFINKMCATL